MTGWTAVAAAGATFVVAGVLVTTQAHEPATAARAARPAAPAVAAAAPRSELDAEIRRLQAHLVRVPRDAGSWASLGFDYVQQAKRTVDPTYYPKAAGALQRSLRLQPRDNLIAVAGSATLANAVHDFHGARRWARVGLAIDGRNAVLLAALTDALTQLGHYRAAERAAARMEAVSPGTPAETRLSYCAELRGDLTTAVQLMRRALADAAGPADVAFTRYYLSQLALDLGRPAVALSQAEAGLRAVPDDVALLEGRARAEAALGRTSAALKDFRTVVERVPQPGYVLEYGSLLERLGHRVAAAQQWRLFRTEERLFRANGVTLDSDAVLFETEHGDPARAVRLGAAALRTRPFLDTYDAYGWALHRAGRDAEALIAVRRALSTGMRNPLFLQHRAQIEHALAQPGGRS